MPYGEDLVELTQLNEIKLEGICVPSINDNAIYLEVMIYQPLRAFQIVGNRFMGGHTCAKVSSSSRSL